MKILVAHSDPLARGMLEPLLTQWGYQVVLAENVVQARARLKEHGGPSVAIMPRNLGGEDSLEVCAQIRSTLDMPYVYFLLIMDEKRRQAALEAGQEEVDDVLSSPLDADEIQLRLRLAKRVLQLEGELKRANDSIRYQTSHDPLTGLFNRTEIISTLGREVSRMRRDKAPLSVILAAVNDLKGINADFGHAAGDAVLRETVRRMRSVVRPYDSIGRYTGEEFMVVVPGCDLKSAVAQADRLRAAVSQGGMDISEWGKFKLPKDSRFQISLALGYVEGQSDIEVGAFLRAAEESLRSAEAAAGKSRQTSSGPAKN